MTYADCVLVYATADLSTLDVADSWLADLDAHKYTDAVLVASAT